MSLRRPTRDCTTVDQDGRSPEQHDRGQVRLPPLRLGVDRQ
jgi:hypothetical protein